MVRICHKCGKVQSTASAIWGMYWKDGINWLPSIITSKQFEKVFNLIPIETPIHELKLLIPVGTYVTRKFVAYAGPIVSGIGGKEENVKM